MKLNNISKIIALIIITIIFCTQVSVAATTGKVTSDDVRVREQPTTSSKILDLVSINDEVQVLEKSGDWYKVTVTKDGKTITGYIRGDLMSVADESQLTTDSNTKTGDSNTTVNEQPNTSTGDVQTGDNNQSGETENPSTAENDEFTTLGVDKTQVIEGSKLKLTKDINIKIVPLVNSSNIATIKNGTEVNIIEVINQWARVESEEQIGWVRIDQ